MLVLGPTDLRNGSLAVCSFALSMTPFAAKISSIFVKHQGNNYYIFVLVPQGLLKEEISSLNISC